jgi:hypothetical protein
VGDYSLGTLGGTSIGVMSHLVLTLTVNTFTVRVKTTRTFRTSREYRGVLKYLS